MQFVYRDPNIGSRLTVAAIAGGKLLTRGAEYRVWVNPLDGGKAYVCDLQGRYIGVAKVLQAVRADATPEELAAQLGLRQRVLSDEARRLAPIARRRQAEANSRAAENIAAFGLEDPVERAAAEEAARREVANVPDVAEDELLSDDGHGGIDVSDEEMDAASRSL